MAFTTFDPSNAVNITLSGGNLVATSQASLGNVRAVDPQVSGKWYWEVTLTTSPGLAYCAVGLANGAAALGNQLNNGTQGAGTAIAECDTTSGQLFVGGSFQSKSINVPTSGTVVCIAVDLTAKLMWWRAGATGSWNATSGTANDPASGTGGISIASIAPAYQEFYPLCGGIKTSCVWTANFGASSFAGTVPSGFNSGWTTGVTPANNLVITQAGAEAWFDPNPSVRITQAGVERWVDATTVTVPLTGVSAMGAAGSLAPRLDAARTLSGVGATGGVGSLIPVSTSASGGHFFHAFP